MKIRRKPVGTEEAIQFTGTPENSKEVYEFISKCIACTVKFYPTIWDIAFARVDMPKGFVEIVPGDYVTRNKNGELNVCESARFSDIFEVVE